MCYSQFSAVHFAPYQINVFHFRFVCRRPQNPVNPFKIVQCAKLASKKVPSIIHVTAKCAGDVRLGLRSDIGKNVKIGKGSKFGHNLEIRDGAVLGDKIVAGTDVEIGKNACIESNTHLPNDEEVANWAKVRPKSAHGGIIKTQPKAGYKFTLQEGQCSLEQRVAPESQPNNDHLVTCISIIEGDEEETENVDETAKCGEDTTFGHYADIGSGVAIGHGGEMDDNFTVGSGSELGDFIVAGEEVTLGEHVCVESLVAFPANAKIEDFAAVQLSNGFGYTVTPAPRNKMFVLRKGKCVPTKRYALLIDKKRPIVCIVVAVAKCVLSL